MTIEATSGLPPSWCIAELGDVTTKPQYGWTTKADSTGKNLKLLRTSDITTGRVNWQTVPTCVKEPDDPEKYFLKAGDIVVARAGSVGKSILLREDVTDAVFASYLVKFTPHISSEYIDFFMKSRRYWEQIEDKSSGIAVPNVNASKLSQIKLPIAPIDEQRRIVEKIETLFAQLDKGEEGLREVQKLLARYRQSVLKAAVTGQLTAEWRSENCARKWRSIQLGDVTEFLTSGSRGWAKYYADEGDLFIRAQNLKFDRLVLDDVAYVSLPEKSEGKRTRVQVGDLLITITGANVTKTALVEADLGTAYVSQHVALLRPTHEALPEFLYWFIVAASAGRKQLEDFAYGAGKPGLNLTNIREVAIELPGIEEQRVIVDLIDDLLSRAAAVEAAVANQLTRSSALRQSILKDAFSGRLVAQDPKDEPAVDLLARIRETKTEAPRKRRRSATA